MSFDKVNLGTADALARMQQRAQKKNKKLAEFLANSIKETLGNEINSNWIEQQISIFEDNYEFH
jgi:hypothetical protein